MSEGNFFCVNATGSNTQLSAFIFIGYLTQSKRKEEIKKSINNTTSASVIYLYAGKTILHNQKKLRIHGKVELR